MFGPIARVADDWLPLRAILELRAAEAEAMGNDNLAAQVADCLEDVVELGRELDSESDLALLEGVVGWR